MEVRYAVGPTEVAAMDTEALRSAFLLADLAKPEFLNLVYSHEDRLVIGMAIPTFSPLQLRDTDQVLKTQSFLDRREVGIVNVGESGRIEVDGKSYALDRLDGLYVGRGHSRVTLFSDSPEHPARYYLVSTLAHMAMPTEVVRYHEVASTELGDAHASNRRLLRRYIHQDGVNSCQLMLGLTELLPGMMWNTMPPHLHDRRTEVYFYFGLPPDDRIFHVMGEPQQTRHLIVANEQAVISPSWSIHAGVGNSHYSFIWAMGGENYDYTDMETVHARDLR